MSQLVKNIITDGEPIAKFMNEMDGKSRILDLIDTTMATQHTVNGVPINVDAEDLALMNIAILEVIKRFGYLSINELKYVFSRGLTSEFGEMTHFFNAKNVNIWLKKWSEERKSFVKEIIHKRNKQEYSEPMSDQERERLHMDLVSDFCDWIDSQRQRWAESVLSGATFKLHDIEDHYGGGLWYDKLIEMSVLEPPTKEEKLKAIEAYKEKALMKMKSSRASRHIHVGDGSVESRARTYAKFHFVKRLLLNWFENDFNYRELLTS